MFALNFTKTEIDFIREQANFTDEEMFIYDMIVDEMSFKEMIISLEENNMHMSDRTLSRRKDKISKKIVRVVDKYFSE